MAKKRKIEDQSFREEDRKEDEAQKEEVRRKAASRS